MNPSNVTGNGDRIPYTNFMSDLNSIFLTRLKDSDALFQNYYSFSTQDKILDNSLETYLPYVNWNKSTYEKIKTEAIKSLSDTVMSTSHAMKARILDYHNTLASHIINDCKSVANSPFTYIPEYRNQFHINLSLANWDFLNLPGHNPSSWPFSLDSFYEKMKNMFPFSLFFEPIHILQASLIEKMKNFMMDCVARLEKQNEKDDYFNYLKKAMVCYILMQLHSGNFQEIINALNFFVQLENSIKDKKFVELLAPAIYSDVCPTLQKLENFVIDKKHIHFMSALSNYGTFKISKFAQFSKQNFSNTSMTTDGTYLYLIVSVIGGGMYKIGTGANNTIEGKVYLSIILNKQEDVCWVYCKGKLYLRSSTKDLGSIDIFDPITLKYESTIQFYCPEIFNHPTLQQLNKNFPLLTDGDNVYTIGKLLVTEILEKQKESQPKVPPPSNQNQPGLPADSSKDATNLSAPPRWSATNKKNPDAIDPAPVVKQKTDIKKVPNKAKAPVPAQKDAVDKQADNVLKILNYVLFEFDINESPKNADKDDFENIKENPLVLELYESFSGLFTFKECFQALEYSKQDIQSAAQWLIEEGENQRTKKIIHVKRSCLIAQAEMTSDISLKTIKNNPEITVKDDSVLFPHNVSGNSWSMNKNYLTLYCDNGIKIFSTEEKNIRPLEKNFKDSDLLNDFSKIQFHNPENLVKTSESRDDYGIEKGINLEKIDEEGGLKKGVQLSGTLLNVLDKNKYSFCSHTYQTTCYDHEGGKFYTYLWSCNSVTSVLPASICVSVDNSFYERIVTDITESKSDVKEENIEDKLLVGKSIKDLKSFILEFLVKIQKKRFLMPFCLDKFDIMYIKSIGELISTKNNGEIPENESNNKKFKSILKKLKERALKLSKMTSKQTEANSLLILNKQYALCLIPNQETLDILLQELKNPYVEKDIIMKLICIWLLQVPPSGNFIWKKDEFSQILMKCENLFDEIINYPNKTLSKRALYYGYDFFMISPANLSKMIKLAFAELHDGCLNSNKNAIDWSASNKLLLKLQDLSIYQSDKFETNFSALELIYEKHASYPSAFFAPWIWMKEYYIEEFSSNNRITILSDQENNKITSIFKPKNSKKFSHRAFIIPIGSLLCSPELFAANISGAPDGTHEKLMAYLGVLENRSEGDLFDQARNSIYSEIDNSLSDLIEKGSGNISSILAFKFILRVSWEVIQKYCAYNDTKKIAMAINKFLDIIEKSLENIAKLIENNKTGNKSNSLYYYYKILQEIINPLSLCIYLHYNISNIESCEVLTWRLVKILKILLSTLDLKDGSNLLQHIKAENVEGIDPLYVKTCETNHPYERGKVINFDPIYFPNAIAISVEFDKKCQSDTSHDNLMLNSWYEGQNPNLNVFYNARENLGMSYKVSGKPQLKNPIIMLGNHLQVDFTSNASARNQKSLTRWGFKIKVSPIFPMSVVFPPKKSNEIEYIYELFDKNIEKLKSYILSIHVIAIGIKKLSHLLQNKIPIQPVEIKYKNILNWALMKNGSRMPNLSTKLSNENGIYYYKDSLGEEEKSSVARSVQAADAVSQPTVVELDEDDLGSIVKEVIEKRGDICDVIIQVKRMSPVPMNYTNERRRPTFTAELKKRWDLAEDLIIFVLLYQMEILKLIRHSKSKKEINNLVGQVHLQEQLQAISKKKNEVLSWMLSRLQSEREFFQILEEMIENYNKHIIEEENEKIKKEQHEAEQLKLKKQAEEAKLKEEIKILPKPVDKKKLTITKKAGGRKKGITISKKSANNQQQSPQPPIISPPLIVSEPQKTNTQITEVSPISPQKTLVPTNQTNDHQQIEALKNRLLVVLKNRLEGNSKSISSLCLLKKISFYEDDLAKSMQGLFEYFYDSLHKIPKNTETKIISPTNNNAYESVASLIINRCIFLTKMCTRLKTLKSSANNNINDDDDEKISQFDNENDEHNDYLPPISAQRSISMALSAEVNDKSLNARVEDLRDYINSYQRWKSWIRSEAQTQELSVNSDACSPLVATATFLTHDESLSLTDLQTCIEIQTERAAFRIMGVQLSNELLLLIKSSCLDKYVNDFYCTKEEEGLFNGIRLVNPEFKSIIIDLLLARVQLLTDILSNQYQKISNLQIESLLKSLSENKELGDSLENFIIDFFKSIYLNMAELSEIFSNEIIMKHEVWGEFYKDEKKQERMKSLIYNILNLGIFASSFAYVTENNHRILWFTKLIKTTSIVVLFKLLKNIGSTRVNITMLELSTQLIQKELGIITKKKIVINKMIKRSADPSGISRFNFLFCLINEILTHPLFQPETIYHELASTLLYFIEITLVPVNQAGALQIVKKLQNYINYKDLESYSKYIIRDINKDFKYDKSNTTQKGFIDVSPEEDEKKSNLITNLIQKIGKQLRVPNIAESKQNKNKYAVLVSVPCEEDVFYFIQALFFWEEKHPCIKLMLPKTWEEHLERKKSPQNNANAQNAGMSPILSNQSENSNLTPSNIQKQKVEKQSVPSKFCEKIFINLPECNCLTDDESDLPIAWQLNYHNIYPESKIKINLTRQSIKKTPKKTWANPSLSKLDQKYKEALKLAEEVKENESPEEKNQKMQVGLFALKMIEILKESLRLTYSLSVNGYAVVDENLTQDEANELALLFTLAKQGKLKSIVTTFNSFSEEWRKKLDPCVILTPPPPKKDAPPTPNPTDPANMKSNVKVLLINSVLLPAYEEFHESILGNPAKESFYTDANRFSLMHETVLSGHCRCIIIQQLLQFLAENVQKDETLLLEYKKIMTEYIKDPGNPDDLQLGLLVLQGGWNLEYILGAKVDMDGFHRSDNIIISGGIRSGKKNVLLLSESDPTLTIQTTSLANIKKQAFEKILPLLEFSDIIKAILKISNHDNMISQSLHTSIINRLLLGILKEINIEKEDLMLIGEDLPKMLRYFSRLMNQCPVDHSHDYYEERLAESWKRIIDFNVPTFSQIIVPKCTTTIAHEFESDTRKKSCQAYECECNDKEDISNYCLPVSSFASTLPDSHSHLAEFKMLKYWEKHIIPKLQDFTRASFKAYEFREYFEQIRQPLRKGDQSLAAEIAYILCDQKLPPGCILPDNNHDWNSINIEEVQIGQYALCKIMNKKKLICPFTNLYHKLSTNEILVQVIGLDLKSFSTLLLFADDQNGQLITFWAPVSCLKNVELPLIPPATSFSKIILYEDFSKHIHKAIAFKAREVMLSIFNPKCFDFIEKLTVAPKEVNDFEIMRNILVDFFSHDPIEGWLKNMYSLSESLEFDSFLKPHKTAENILTKIQTQYPLPSNLESIQLYINTLLAGNAKTELQAIIDKISEKSQRILNFLNKNRYSFDMKKPVDLDYSAISSGNLALDVYPLNIFMKDNHDTISAICISFKNNANLGMCSGVKFYDDPLGINMINHIQTGLDSQKTNISPLIFKQSKVYYQYYFTSEALPLYLTEQATSNLPCIVYGIPSNWSVICWMIDAISTGAVYNKTKESLFVISKLIPILQNLIINFIGPSILLQQLYSLLTRLIFKMRVIIRASNISESEALSALSFTKEFITLTLNKAEQLLKPSHKNKVNLCSSLSQVIQEMLATLFCPIVISKNTCYNFQKNFTNAIISKDIISLIKVVELSEFLTNQSKYLTPDTMKEVLYSFSIEGNQFDLIVRISGLPLSSLLSDEDNLENKIKKVIEKFKGRLLIQDKDFKMSELGDECVFILDGWSILTLDDEAKAKKEAEPVEPPAPVAKKWKCPICTLLNILDSQICVACENPKPPNPSLVADDENMEEEEKEEENVSEHNEEPENEISVSNMQRMEALIGALKTLINECYEKIESNHKKDIENRNAQMKAAYEEALKKGNQIDPPTYFEYTADERAELTITTGRKALEGSNFSKEMLISRLFLGEKLIEKVEKVIKDNEENFKKYLKTETSILDLAKREPITFYKMLENIGIDFWFNQAFTLNKDQLRLLPPKLLELLLSFVEVDVCKETKASLFYPANNLRFASFSDYVHPDAQPSINYDDDLASCIRYRSLAAEPLYNLRYSWAIIRLFNRELHSCISHIDMKNYSNYEASSFYSLGSMISSLRHYCVGYLKTDLHFKVLQMTALPRDHTPKITLERISINSQIYNENKDEINNISSNNNFIYLKAFEQMKSIPATMLRPIKPTGTDPFVCFEVLFRNEQVMGEAGPYRQFFADISSELQPGPLKTHQRNLKLLCPSPNNLSQIGDHKDKFVINPTANTNYHLQLFEFLGLLMGCCVRTGTHLTLDLPLIFWKQLVGQEITLEDIMEIDIPTYNLLKFLQECSVEVFEDSIFENYVTFLSDRSQQELIPNGKNIKVKFEDRFDFIEMVLKARINEAKLQIESIKKGFGSIIPTPFINTLSAKDLEIWVCGRSKVDFVLLKRHTRYSNNLTEESPLISWFWEILSNLKETEKLRFVKFCWGQERLPANDEEFERTQTRFMVKLGNQTNNADKILPRADTCFFNLELPKYSSKDILKSKLMIAINSDCESMNADATISLDPNNQNNDERDSYEDVVGEEENEDDYK